MADEESETVLEGHRLKERVPVSGSGPEIDLRAIERAEVALGKLSVNFDSWAGEEVARLCAARDAVAEHGYSGDFADDLFRAAHDLKGEAGTFGYPMVGRLSASLCTLLDAVAGKPDLPIDLINHHVDAIRAIVRDQIKGEGNKTAVELFNDLSVITESYVAARLLMDGGETPGAPTA